MHQLFFLFLSITWLLAGCNTASKNTVEATNRVILQKEDTLYEFYAKKYPDDQLSRLSESNKYYHWYSGTAILVTQGAARSRVLDGKYVAYYPGHNLMESGMFAKGLKEGEWRSWYPAGILQNIVSWKNGLQQGTSIHYDRTGKIIRRENFQKGLLSGEQLTYNSDTISERQFFKNGILVMPKVPAIADTVNIQ